MNWFKSIFKGSQKVSENNFDLSSDKDGNLVVQTTQCHGLIDDQHYTSYIDQIKELKRKGDHESAINLLLRAVSATENESKKMGEGWGVAPWYYEQLAIIYRKEKRYEDEIKILERYLAQSLAPGSGAEKLSSRLAKAKELFSKNAL